MFPITSFFTPRLITVVLEHAFKKLERDRRGINDDGETLHHLRFADDIVLVRDYLKDAEDMLLEPSTAL